MIACMQHFISFFLFSNDLICDPIPYVSFVFIQLLFYTYTYRSLSSESLLMNILQRDLITRNRDEVLYVCESVILFFFFLT